MVGEWTLYVNPETGIGHIFEAQEDGSGWCALLQHPRSLDMIYVEATGPEQRYASQFLNLVVEWDGFRTQHQRLAGGRIDVTRDNERRGLAMSAHEQARRLEIPISLSEMRLLVDYFCQKVAALAFGAGREAALPPVWKR